MSKVSDPHPPHPSYGWKTCPTPPTAFLGDTWRCPECGRAYFAADGDDYGDGEGTLRWVVDPSTEQPPLPEPAD